MTIQIGDVVGDYRVIGIAGSGGMGAVYKIEHVITKRIEAMKLLPPDLSNEPEQVQRFEREIQVQARLHHPHIVALYNAVRHGRSIALIMEFVEGESLQRILEHGKTPLKTAIEYTRQVLCALAYAHEHGVIHRDVAPANIIIALDGNAKLTDFGLARAETDLRLTTSGTPIGSPWYMSPEQVRGIGVIDARTDIYAVGAILHEMLTGAKLFEADGAFAVMRAQVEAVPSLPSACNPAVPKAVDEIVSRALAKDPEMRFQSADEFRVALEKAVPECAPVAIPEQSALQALAPQVSATPIPSAVPRRRMTFALAARQVMLAAAVPALLVAGLFTVRHIPRTPHAPPPASPRPVAVTVPPPEPVVETAPAPPLPPVTVPMLTPTPAAVPAAAPARLPLIQPAPPKPVQSVARTPHPAATPPRSTAIRVTGGEVMPSSSMPAPSPVAATSAAPEPVRPAPEPAPPTATVPTQPATAVALPSVDNPVQETTSAKPDKPRNSFVRALGKINPFRKQGKDEPGEAPKAPGKQN